MSTRLAIAVLVAASEWGGNLVAQRLIPAGVDSATEGFSGEPMRAEDSPLMRSMNLTFYDSPRGPEMTPREAPAATVSVEQLRHPVSRKGLKLLAEARSLSVTGRHDEAILRLQLALKERSAAPYAHSMLGAEYLKTNRVPEAVSELQQALAILPHNVPDRSNLGYALFLSGDLGGAERETRHALELDRDNPKTRQVLNRILTARAAGAETRP